MPFNLSALPPLHQIQMPKSHSIRSLVCSSVLTVSFLSILGVANAQVATDYAIFSTDDVTLDTYSVVNGDVYSGRNLNVEFGYGIQVRDLNSGDMYAAQNYTQESLSDIDGNVFANGNAELIGSAEVHGNLTLGGEFIGSKDDVDGSVLQNSNSVPTVALPAATQFNSGTNDVVTDSSITVAPGTYRNFQMTGLFDEVSFTSGDYYFRNFKLDFGGTISLTITNNEPVNFFITGDADFGSGLDFVINGVEIGRDTPDSITDLAHIVLFEIQGDVEVGAGSLNQFFGTIFAPDGNVNVDLQYMYGSIISGRPIAAEVYLDHKPSSYLTTPSAPVMGDVNRDQVVNFLDIGPFIFLLSTNGFQDEADMDQNGVVNFVDIGPFVALMQGP